MTFLEAWEAVRARWAHPSAAPGNFPQQSDIVTAPAEPGMVAFQIEAIPHDSPNDGELWHKGTMPPAEVAALFRAYADQVESFTPPANA